MGVTPAHNKANTAGAKGCLAGCAAPFVANTVFGVGVVISAIVGLIKERWSAFGYGLLVTLVIAVITFAVMTMLAKSNLSKAKRLREAEAEAKSMTADGDI